MAFDFGDALDVLRGLTDWPGGASGRQGPARKRVGRWSGRVIILIVLITVVSMLATWATSDDFAAFDRNGLPVLSLGLLALFVALVVHTVAAIVANILDRRSGKP